MQHSYALTRSRDAVTSHEDREAMMSGALALRKALNGDAER